LRLVVRTWNVFHGRTKPPSGGTHLERMIRLVAAGADVVALQEVPAWALRALEDWSGMAVAGAVARPGHLGAMGRRVTALAPDFFRSFLNGQANALLVSRSLAFTERQRIVELKRRGVVERRICQLARVRADDSPIVLVNFHATAHVHDVARRQVERVGTLLAGEEAAIVCGDFNVPGTGLPGFSAPVGGIDQILVRGLTLEARPARWPPERRRLENGALLSDHPPVEAVVGA
jgi:endonuclease/exonuclease/phosphatase family metal-dependent hydrolase